MSLLPLQQEPYIVRRSSFDGIALCRNRAGRRNRSRNWESSRNYSRLVNNIPGAVLVTRFPGASGPLEPLMSDNNWWVSIRPIGNCARCGPVATTCSIAGMSRVQIRFVRVAFSSLTADILGRNAAVLLLRASHRFTPILLRRSIMLCWALSPRPVRNL